MKHPCPDLSLPLEEPMRRFSHPLPEPVEPEDLNPALTRILEELAVENQLLVDLLAAVNSLTAVVLAAQAGKRETKG